MKYESAKKVRSFFFFFIRVKITFESMQTVICLTHRYFHLFLLRLRTNLALALCILCGVASPSPFMEHIPTCSSQPTFFLSRNSSLSSEPLSVHFSQMLPLPSLDFKFFESRAHIEFSLSLIFSSTVLSMQQEFHEYVMCFLFTLGSIFYLQKPMVGLILFKQCFISLVIAKFLYY